MIGIAPALVALLFGIGAALLVAGNGLAQAAGAVEDSKPGQRIVIRITTRSVGEAQPRKYQGSAVPGVQRLVGRQIVWQIGDRVLESVTELRGTLSRLAQDPDVRRANLVRGELHCRIDPAADVRWCEVLATMDMVHEAGFDEVSPVGSHCALTPVGSEPVSAAGQLALPWAVFHVDGVRNPERPEFEVDQAGRVRLGNETLIEPPTGDDVEEWDATRLGATMRALGAALAKAGRRPKNAPDGLDILRRPMLVRADRWTRWGAIRRVLAVATADDVGFYMIELAVADPNVAIDGMPELEGERQVFLRR